MSTITRPTRRPPAPSTRASRSNTLLLEIHLPQRRPLNRHSVALLAGLLGFSAVCWSVVIGVLLVGSH